MDLFKIILQLHEERERLDKVISALEELSRGKAAAAAASARQDTARGGPQPPVAPSASAAPLAGKRKRGRPRKNPGGGEPGSTAS